MFSHIQTQQDAWLASASDELDFSTDPDNHYIQDDPSRAIYSKDVEVIIGTSIYKEIEGGLGVKIRDLNFDDLDKLQSLPQTIPVLSQNATERNWELVGAWNEPTYRWSYCRWWDEDKCTYRHPSNNDRRVKYEIGCYNSFVTFVSKIWAENKSYKRAWIGWSRTDEPHYVHLSGRVWTESRDGNNCGLSQVVSLGETKTSAHLAEAEYKQFPSSTRLRVSDDGYLFSSHNTYKSSPVSTNYLLNKGLCLPERRCSPSDCND